MFLGFASLRFIVHLNFICIEDLSTRCLYNGAFSVVSNRPCGTVVTNGIVSCRYTIIYSIIGKGI